MLWGESLFFNAGWTNRQEREKCAMRILSIWILTLSALGASQSRAGDPAWPDTTIDPIPGAEPILSPAESIPGVVCDQGDPNRCAMPIRKGAPAPFAGQLLTPRLAIDLGQKANSCQDRIDMRVTHEAKLAAIDLETERKMHQIDVASWARERKLLLLRLEEAHTTPWYSHPAFVATVSVLAASALTYGSIYLAEKIK